MNVTKGLKIVHMTNWAPNKSGMYESVEEMMYEERRLGYDARIVDVVPNNPLRMREEKNHRTLRDGLVKGFENEEWSSEADILCWHRYLPEIYFKDPRKNLVLFLHGQPDFVFFQEEDDKDKAFSLIKGAYNSLPQCSAFIGMWRDHDLGYWGHLLPGKLVSTCNPWMNLDRVRMHSDSNFNPNHIRLANFDTWRSTKTPFYVVNAVKTLIRQYEAGEIPYKITLDLFGQEPKGIKNVWIVLCQEYINKYIFFRGYAHNQEIFDNFDAILTTGSEETRVVRESLAAGMPLIVGETHCDYTDYKAPFRAPHKYAEEILRMCGDLRDDKKRKAIMEKNRKYAVDNFDIRKNIRPVIETFERIARESRMKEYTPKYWEAFPSNAKSVEDGNQIELSDSHGTKVLNCTVSDDGFGGYENIDKYSIRFDEMINYNEEAEYIVDYKIDEKFPDNYFDAIYVDYLDILPRFHRERFEKYLKRIKKEDGKIIKGHLKGVKL